MEPVRHITEETFNNTVHSLKMEIEAIKRRLELIEMGSSNQVFIPPFPKEYHDLK